MTHRPDLSLAAAIQQSLGLRDYLWIARIERLRRQLLRSTASIEIVDFGAGSHAEQVDDRPRTENRCIATRSLRDTCVAASKSRAWNTILMRLVRAYRPARAVELGTCLGLSAAYQAAAMAVNGAGTLQTLEGSPALADLSTSHLRRLGLPHATVVTGRFTETLPAVLANGLQYAYIDGHHDETATLQYFDQIAAVADAGSVFVFDDIAWSAGMTRAWRAIQGNPRVVECLDLREIGIVRLR